MAAVAVCLEQPSSEVQMADRKVGPREGLSIRALGCARFLLETNGVETNGARCRFTAASSIAGTMTIGGWFSVPGS
jgi:hypothetical protein